MVQTDKINQLVKVTESHLTKMMTWFSNKEQLTQWSGPNFTYPFNRNSFKRDLKLDQLSSFVLQSTNNDLLAFGQYYRRLERCHLGRLVVSPDHRGKGLAKPLMTLLINKGCKKLVTSEASLFVLSCNASAICAYEKFGFVIAEYPEKIPLDDCLYMTKAWLDK